jgi:flagellar motor component MotA
MFAIIGIVVVFGAIVAGYLMEKGNLLVLMQPAELIIIGGAALVGTFLGILLCYGLVGPLGANMSKGADAHNEYLQVLRVLMLSFLKGNAPIIAIEMARRAIPAHVRPSFEEMEKASKGGGAAAVAAEAA